VIHIALIIGNNLTKTTKKSLKKRKRRKKMIEKINDLIDMIPDTAKCIIIISVIALFWDIMLGL